MLFHVGEDLLSTMLVVMLLGVFMSAVVHSYDLNIGRQRTSEEFRRALLMAERLRDGVLTLHGSGPPEAFTGALENYLRQVISRSQNFQIRIRTTDEDLLLLMGPDGNQLSGYASTNGAASLPVPIPCGDGSAKLCELSVQVWGK